MYIHFSFLSVRLSICLCAIDEQTPNDLNLYKNFTIIKQTRKYRVQPELFILSVFFFIVNLKVGREKRSNKLYHNIFTFFFHYVFFFMFSILCDYQLQKKKNCSAPNKNSQIVNFSYSGYFHNNPCAGNISKEPYLIFQSSPGHTYVCVYVCMCCYACLRNWSIFSKVFPSVSPSLSSSAPFLSLPVFSLISIIDHLPGQLSHGLGPSHFTSKTVSHRSWRRTVPTLLFCIHWVILCWHIMYVHSSTCVIIHFWFWVV